MEAIKLRQGDSLNWLGRKVEFTLNTDLDMSGWVATFQLGELIKVYKDFNETKAISLDITKEESETLPLGYLSGWLKFTNADGLAGTHDIQVKFLILPKEVENVTIV